MSSYLFYFTYLKSLFYKYNITLIKIRYYFYKKAGISEYTIWCYVLYSQQINTCNAVKRCLIQTLLLQITVYLKLRIQYASRGCGANARTDQQWTTTNFPALSGNTTRRVSWRKRKEVRGSSTSFAILTRYNKLKSCLTNLLNVLSKYSFDAYSVAIFDSL